MSVVESPGRPDAPQQLPLLTEKLRRYLLRRQGRAVSFEELQRACSLDVRAVRGRVGELRSMGVPIVTVGGYGYLIPDVRLPAPIAEHLTYTEYLLYGVLKENGGAFREEIIKRSTPKLLAVGHVAMNQKVFATTVGHLNRKLRAAGFPGLRREQEEMGQKILYVDLMGTTDEEEEGT